MIKGTTPPSPATSPETARTPETKRSVTLSVAEEIFLRIQADFFPDNRFLYAIVYGSRLPRGSIEFADEREILIQVDWRRIGHPEKIVAGIAWDLLKINDAHQKRYFGKTLWTEEMLTRLGFEPDPTITLLEEENVTHLTIAPGSYLDGLVQEYGPLLRKGRYTIPKENRHIEELEPCSICGLHDKHRSQDHARLLRAIDEERICNICAEKKVEHARKEGKLPTAEECRALNLRANTECPVCGTWFESRRSTRKTCSNACKQKAYRDKETAALR